MSDDKNYIDFDDNENDNDNIEIESCDDINNIEQDDNDIDEEFIDFDDVNDIEEDNNFDILHRFNTNKHKQEGKHSLKRDTIFKGKKDDKNEDMSQSDDSYYDNINIFEIQYNENDDIISSTDLTKDVYDILDEKTDIDFKQNRRKPNKDSFNNYYNLLVKELGYRYTRSEIFVELSYYFTDNIFNMFKLLDKKPAMNIIKELTQKGFLKNLDGINFL
ncbi:MAG: hypothetical protein WDA02_02195 [Saccharofermentanales bacterium]